MDEIKERIDTADGQINKYEQSIAQAEQAIAKINEEWLKLPQEQRTTTKEVKFEERLKRQQRILEYFTEMLRFAKPIREGLIKKMKALETPKHNEMRYALPDHFSSENNMSIDKEEQKENVSENIDDSMSLDKREQTFTGLGIPGAHGQELNENRNDNFAVPEQNFQEPWPNFNVAQRPKAPLPIQSNGGSNDIPIFPDHPLPIPPNIPPVPNYPPPAVPLILPDGEYLPDHRRNNIIHSINL